MCCFDPLIHCNMIGNMSATVPSPNYHILVAGTFHIYSLNNFQIHNILLIIITMLFIKSTGLRGSWYPLTNFLPFPPPSFYSLFLWAEQTSQHPKIILILYPGDFCPLGQCPQFDICQFGSFLQKQTYLYKIQQPHSLVFAKMSWKCKCIQKSDYRCL